jgi:hypothetical protein
MGKRAHEKRVEHDMQQGVFAGLVNPSGMVVLADSPLLMYLAYHVIDLLMGLA